MVGSINQTQIDEIVKIKMPVINKYINFFLFFAVEKKISHLENNEVVIIKEKTVQMVLWTKSSTGPAKQADLK